MVLHEYNEKEIRELLLYRKVIKVAEQDMKFM